MLNRLGIELRDLNRPARPITMPAFNLPVVDGGAERREIAARFAEHRIVAKGRTAWEAVARAERETFENWKAVAAALVIGRSHAMRVACTSTPNGAHYTAALSQWLTKNFSNRPMPKATRYWCLRLHENLPAIEKWRQSLSERERQKLINPLSVVRRWYRATHANGKCPDDPVKAATAAWARFRSCLEALPADQAAPLWQAALAEAHLCSGVVDKFEPPVKVSNFDQTATKERMILHVRPAGAASPSPDTPPPPG